MTRGRCGLFLAIAIGAASAAGDEAPASNSAVVATVDRSEITAAEVEVRLLLSEQAEQTGRPDREAIIEDLIDRRLIRAFLTQKGVKVPDDLIELQWTKLEEAAAAGKLDLAKVLSRLGYTEKALKDDLRLPLAWTSYVKKQTTDDQVRKFFGDHKNHFDGTTRHVRHLVVIVPEGAPVDAWSKAEARLNELRGEITAGKISFADAAKANSDSPTKESGGDLGFVHFHGDLAPPVAEAAFATKLKNVSEPVRSPFGVHLVMVEEERAGDISLEDARADVLEAIAQSMWAQQTQELRKKAKITRPAGR